MARISMYMEVDEYNKYENGHVARGCNREVTETAMHVSIHASEVIDYLKKTEGQDDGYNSGRSYVHYVVKKVKGFGD